jgi:hypothetical protein
VYTLNEKVTEQLVAQIWQHQLVTKLITDAGEKVDVIFPGRFCSDGGSDFCDAVLNIGDKAVRGNIEVHVKLSQWYSHGHHENDKYNDVILHVVMWRDSASATVSQNGRVIPSVSLSTHLKHTFFKNKYNRTNLLYHCSPSCRRAKSYFTNESLPVLLSAAGEERFVSKVAIFHRALITENAGQVLFKGIARALGYDKNTKPFEDLTDILPLKVLERRWYDERGLTCQSLILGSAGLLPFQWLGRDHRLSEESQVLELEAIWRSLHINRAMNRSDWYFFRVRPCNFPTRRLVALSFLINRYSKYGLLDSILDLVNEIPDKKGHLWIENGLIINGQDYWASHSDFGIKMPRRQALLGSRKAVEIIVNIILQFAYAWGTINSISSLRDKAKSIYLSLPELESNQLVRFMKQQLSIGPNLNISASQHQGLLHIYKNYCQFRNCIECPVNLRLN